MTLTLPSLLFFVMSCSSKEELTDTGVAETPAAQDSSPDEESPEDSDSPPFEDSEAPPLDSDSGDSESVCDTLELAEELTGQTQLRACFEPLVRSPLPTAFDLAERALGQYFGSFAVDRGETVHALVDGLAAAREYAPAALS